MLKSILKFANTHLRGVWGTLVFFIFLFLLLLIVVKPQLIFQGGGEITNFPVFYTGWHFFKQTLLQPGGLVQYISAFLAQLLFYPWLGAFVLTSHAFLICLFTGLILKAVGIRRFYYVSLLPDFILLITYNNYTYHFETATALLASLIFVYIYTKTASANKVTCIILFIVMCSLLFLAAAGAFLFFALICCIYEIFYRRSWFVGILYLLLTAAIGFFLGIQVLNISLLDVYSKLLPFSWRITRFQDRNRLISLIWALYLLLPSIMVITGLSRLFKPMAPISSNTNTGIETIPNKADTSRIKKPSNQSAKINLIKSSFRNIATAVLQTILPLAAAAAAVFFIADTKRKAMFEADYYLDKSDWSKVIEIARPWQKDEQIKFALNRALYHLDLLPREMFRYQQNPSALFLTSQKDIYQYWKRIDINYELGAVNHCECNLIESLELFGERPFILKRLALVRMAKNDLGTAKTYLGALSKTIVYSGWAKDYLKRIEADPTLSSDMTIQRLRSIMPQKDEAAVNFPVEKMLTDLLEKNGKNKMAFEYLMATYLVNRQLDKFIDNLGRINDFNYPELPRHFEEAILTYTLLRQKEPEINLHINEKAINRISNFAEQVDRFGTNQQAAFNTLQKDYGDTYYFYYLFHKLIGQDG